MMFMEIHALNISFKCLETFLKRSNFFKDRNNAFDLPREKNSFIDEIHASALKI